VGAKSFQFVGRGYRRYRRCPLDHEFKAGLFLNLFDCDARFQLFHTHPLGIRFEIENAERA
jgi:hypothetical protein